MQHEGEQASGVSQNSGRLQKVMVTILGSPQLRDVLLYTTLLLIFTAAWVTVRWPDFAIPAIVIAFVLISGEALLVYVVIKRLRVSSTTDRNRHAGKSE